MSSFAEKVKDELDNFGLDTPDDDVMVKLTGLCNNLAIKPSDFADEWMAFSVNNCNLDLDMEGLTKFERFKLAKTSQSPAVKKERRSVVNATTHIGELFDDILGAYLPETSPVRTPKSQKRPLESPGSSFRVPKVSKTPTRAANQISRIVSRDLTSSLSPINASPSQTYSQRKGSGDVVASFNEGGITPTWGKSTGEVKIEPSTTTLTKPYQYMFQKLSAKSEALDEHLDIMGEMLSTHHGVQTDNMSIPAQGECRVVGRVCCDSTGKMNASSVTLEGSLDMCNGKRVAVDLTSLDRYALFPGQIVAMEGTNPTGRKFIPNKIMDAVPLKKKGTISNEGVTIFGACGPYTSQDSLSYEPLTDLLNKVQDEAPDVLILMGPFVDTKHPLIEKCDVGEMSLSELFTSQIKHITQNIPSHTRLVIVPSQRDAACDPVYPQPPALLPSSHPNTTLVGDPAMLHVNGVNIALTSTDILFHLSSEEISHPPGADRMGRLAGHLLQQHNFYPLHPPPEEVSIDQSHFIKHAFFDCKPDILVLPSDLRYFVKNVSETVVVNPGKLGKGSGTYFKMFVRGSEQVVTNSTFVNIVKI